MFDFVRKHTRIMQFLLFLLIFPSFVLFGLEGYTRLQEKGAAVATVGGVDVLQSEWDAAHRNEVERVRASNPQVDVKQLDTPEARYAVLERLVQQKVFALAAEKSRLMTLDGKLARALQEDPMIASLRTSDGKLDVERYRQLVGAQGMTPEMFESRVRNDLSSRQVLAGLNGSGLAMSSMADAWVQTFLAQRDASLLRFRSDDYVARVKPTDAELLAYYQANVSAFQVPEQMDVEYVLLDTEALKKMVVLKEDDLRTYYTQNQVRLAGQEQRRASHILLTVQTNASEAERVRTREKAQELLAQLKKSPDSFADLARKHSQDPGSAERGGDLDFFARGAMVKPFDEAVFAMEKGQISDVVESEFGYHLIRLMDIKRPKSKSFEELRPEMELDLRKQQAQRLFAEKAELFTNTVYEQSDSLKPVADKLGLEIRRVKSLQRSMVDKGNPVAHPKVLEALFAPDAIERKRNTEAVEIGANQLVSARVVRYAPATAQPFEDVANKVRMRLVSVKASEMARAEGLAKLDALQKTPPAESFKDKVLVSRMESAKLGMPLVDVVLRADVSKLPVLVGVDLGAEGYAIARIEKVRAVDLSKEAAAAPLRQQYVQAMMTMETQAYYEWLKKELKVNILAPKPGVSKVAS